METPKETYTRAEYEAALQKQADIQKVEFAAVMENAGDIVVATTVRLIDAAKRSALNCPACQNKHQQEHHQAEVEGPTSWGSHMGITQWRRECTWGLC